MTDIALEMEHVYKKFTLGERHDSLRDLIPALAKRMLRRVTDPISLAKKEFWALNDVSFTIKKGEAVGIIGHNGAGKSTMLKHLSGIMKPTSGAIAVNGRLSALIEVGAGFHLDLTGRENVYLNGIILGMSKAEVRRKFDEIVEFSGLAEFIDTPVKRYSSGMYARLGFSVAAHMEPDILVIDEVLSVGDFVFQAKGLEKMRSVLNSGATVIFVSHNLRAISDLCERSIYLRRGQLIQDGPTSQVISAYMEQAKPDRLIDADKRVMIDSITISGDDGPRFDFSAGETVKIDVRIKALKDVERVACVLAVVDDKLVDVFNTSTERMGIAPQTLSAGESFTCTFLIDLHLTPGSFNVGIGLYRYDRSELLDNIDTAATLIVRSSVDVRGIANLYPRVSIERHSRLNSA